MDVFFYGLFMDETILAKNGITFANPRIGYLNHYVLKIGERASLIPSQGERAYGIVITVDDQAIQTLYAEESVADYMPENVNVILESDETIPATCYNLPIELLKGSVNEQYAKALHELASRIGLPNDYLAHIKKMFE